MGRYFNVCPCCGANLDPGERCDCGEWKEKKQEPKTAEIRYFRRYENSLQSKQSNIVFSCLQ